MANTSRRQFLRTAGGGIALSFGGLRIFAGEPVLARPSAPDLQRMKQGSLLYGVHFYRPPDPPASERRAMLKTVAQTYHFNTVRFFPSWAYYNPAPDHFELGELEELMGYCDDLGLKVVMGVMLEDAPFWLEAAHPEARYVNANDRVRHLGGASFNVSAGAPGLCLDWHPVREAAAKYIREVTKEVSAHESFFAYDCWNEPNIEPTQLHLVSESIDIGDACYCYCPRTIENFRVWLQKRYGTLEKLNSAWVRRYADWSLIDPPRSLGVYVDWLDWLRFKMERSTDELRFRVEQVRAVDQHGMLECHMGLQLAVDSPAAVLGVNPWRLAEVVETWGLSYFPTLIPDVSWAAARLELTRSQAREKPFWVTEYQGGTAGGGLFRGRNLRPRDIRLGNWLAMVTGAKGFLYWTYYPDSISLESGGFGLVSPSGSPTERVLEAAEDHRVIDAHWDLIQPYKPRAEVALLFDADSALLTFAASGGEEFSAYSFRGHYRALWNCDLWVDFIEPRDIQGGAYRAILVPSYLMAKPKTCDHLRRFVEGGGTLILQTAFGMHGEQAAYNTVIPPYGLDQAFGYQEGENFVIKNGSSSQHQDTSAKISPDERADTEGYLQFTKPVAVKIKAHTFLTPVRAGEGAEVIATYESIPVAISKKLGRGELYYIGTNLGAAIHSGDRGGVELIRALLAGKVKPAVAADQIRPRLIEGHDRALLVLFNESVEDRRERITVPAHYERATNVYSGEQQEVQGHAVRVTVPYESVIVLLLE